MTQLSYVRQRIDFTQVFDEAMQGLDSPWPGSTEYPTYCVVIAAKRVAQKNQEETLFFIE